MKQVAELRPNLAQAHYMLARLASLTLRLAPIRRRGPSQTAEQALQLAAGTHESAAGRHFVAQLELYRSAKPGASGDKAIPLYPSFPDG